MKQFEKQQSNDDCDIDVECEDLRCSMCKIIQASAWRGALEMVKRGIFEHKEALDVIEEELEDE